MQENARAGFPTRAIKRSISPLVGEALHFLKDALGLRVALNLLDNLLLLALPEGTDAAEEQRGNRREVFRWGLIEKSAELTNIGSTNHF